MTPAGTERRPRAWSGPTALLLLFLTLDCALELALLKKPYHDTAAGHLGTMAFFSDAIRAGAWPLWLPYNRFSIPLGSLVDASLWSPVGLALGWVLPYDVRTMAVEDTLWKAIGLAGAFMFARRHLRSPWSAAGVAVCYMGGGLVQTAYAAILTYWSFMILPWVLVAVDLALGARSIAAWCQAAGLLALSYAALVTGGYPGLWLTSPFFVALYAVLMAGRSWRALARLAGAAAAGALLVAAMLSLNIAETFAVPQFGASTARNTVSAFDGVFRPVNVISLWLVNPVSVMDNYGVPQHQYLGLVPALLLALSVPAWLGRARARLRPLLLAGVATVAGAAALSPKRSGAGVTAMEVGVAALLFGTIPTPFRRPVTRDMALLLTALGGVVVASGGPVGNFLRSNVFPFSQIRWNTWYLWIAALPLLVVAWRTAEQLAGVVLRQRRAPCGSIAGRRPVGRLLASALLFVIAIDTLATWLPQSQAAAADRVETVRFFWLIALVVAWGIGAAACLLAARWTRRAVWRRSALWLAGGGVLLAVTLAVGDALAGHDFSRRPAIALPRGGGLWLDLGQQVIVLIGAGVVLLSARRRTDVLIGLTVVAVCDMSLASARYVAGDDVVVVAHSPGGLEGERGFAFSGDQRGPEQLAYPMVPPARQPTMDLPPVGRLPQMAEFDRQMGEPSIFSSLTRFPPAWSTGSSTTAVEVSAPALHADNGAAAAVAADGTAAVAAAGQRGPECAGAAVSAGGGPPVATVTRLLPDRVAVSAAVDCARLMVYTDTWAPGWKVSIDGRPATALRVNEMIRGVIVPAGQHTVEWTYRPAYLVPLLALSGTAALLSVGLLLAPWLYGSGGRLSRSRRRPLEG